MFAYPYLCHLELVEVLFHVTKKAIFAQKCKQFFMPQENICPKKISVQRKNLPKQIPYPNKIFVPTIICHNRRASKGQLEVVLMFRSSHFLFLAFGHFWQQSYKSTKILHNLCLHFARQDGQDRKKAERKLPN